MHARALVRKLSALRDELAAAGEGAVPEARQAADRRILLLSKYVKQREREADPETSFSIRPGERHISVVVPRGFVKHLPAVRASLAAAGYKVGLPYPNILIKPGQVAIGVWPKKLDRKPEEYFEPVAEQIKAGLRNAGHAGAVDVVLGGTIPRRGTPARPTYLRPESQ